MFLKFAVILAVQLAITTLCFSHVSEKERTALDSVSVQSRERTERFYDSLQSKTTKRAVPRFLYNTLFVRTKRDTLKSDRVVDESSLLKQYEGLEIGTITIECGTIFDKEGNFLERLANNTHFATRQRTIRRDLLFRSGDKLDPKRIVNNKQLLRSRNYISDVSIDVIPTSGDSTVVDVVIRTRDSWTLSVDASLNFKGRTMLELYDANIFGFGNKLSVRTNFNWATGDYGGNVVEYDIPNIMGTFFKGNFIAGRSFENTNLGFAVQKDFILPTDYEVGFSYYDRHQPVYLLSADTTSSIDTRSLDFWAGRSRYVKSINSSIYLMARYGYKKFDSRPEIGELYNPAFHESKDLLASIGLYREKFYTSNLIYGYGNKEYISTGYKAEVMGGYTWGEFSNNWYVGMQYQMGGFTPIGYIMGRFTLGSYIDPVTGKWHRSGVDLEVRGFSNLLLSGRSRVRQFLSLTYTHGWNRYDGANELIRFTKERGPRGFDAYAVGVSRAVFNTETVVFTPFQPLGFRIALFGFADFGLLGGSANIFRNDFFSTFGIGIRLKNERLVFNTIQIKLGVGVSKHGFIKSEYFNISNEQRITKFRYLPTRPETIDFR